MAEEPINCNLFYWIVAVRLSGVVQCVLKSTRLQDGSSFAKDRVRNIFKDGCLSLFVDLVAIVCAPSTAGTGNE